MSTQTVSLSPAPGFCIKSTTNASSNQSLPVGVKCFINVAWDPAVPAPPKVEEEVVQRAMRGEEKEVEGYFVPIVTSGPRETADKSGKPSLVFDTIISSALKPRTLRDPEFKAFLAELCLQRVETTASTILARPYSTPNIRSKGPLEPRQTTVPVSLPITTRSASESAKKKSLIEELNDAPGPKGILKSSPGPSVKTNGTASQHSTQPKWRWSQPKPDDFIQLYIDVPSLTHAHIPTSTLDIEPRRVLLSIPSIPSPSSRPLYTLDINLDLPDAQLATLGQPGQEAMLLKRKREFEVEGARAEWRVRDGCIVIFA